MSYYQLCEHHVAHFVAFRFADRDVVMRYHWGKAVGHIYSYSTSVSSPNQSPVVPQTLASDHNEQANTSHHAPTVTEPPHYPEETQRNSGSDTDSDDHSEYRMERDADSDSSEEGSVDGGNGPNSTRDLPGGEDLGDDWTSSDEYELEMADMYPDCDD